MHSIIAIIPHKNMGVMGQGRWGQGQGAGVMGAGASPAPTVWIDDGGSVGATLAVALPLRFRMIM
ncbi:hypothetical protein EYB53_017770 [Candidatus Chloroploca sp. M-50]|uniref:Uncharacterized protein n=1 Tax=Candidatus Chloroploca mongolica TaxID=2528176 RepID=A0ABS4DDP9_9CHLR|nr:hypothetical protein [Candidatus Chloroploca mongolica]MBP1467566.1 hypothetical protein [Candidatus Chloroploca mongolica]